MPHDSRTGGKLRRAPCRGIARTRSAPLAVVFHRSERFAMHTVVDERCAAFMALGMALKSERPVLLICTSGSALMNYGPALAEAYHRRVPLITVSADRPPDG